MKITPTQTNFNGYRINAEDNKHVKFLYNKAMDVLKTEQQTVTVRPNYITFDKITEKMRKMFVDFMIVVRKDEK